MFKKLGKYKRRIFEIIEVGTKYDYASRIYDFFNAFCIIVNLAVSMLYTFEEYRAQYGALLLTLEELTVALFLMDYILRIWTQGICIRIFLYGGRL